MARGYPDFEGQKSGLYPIAEWAAKEGIDKTLEAAGTDKAWGGTTTVTYIPAAGKTFYIAGWSFSAHPSDIANAGADAFAVGYIRSSGKEYGRLGGNYGAAIIFDVPVVVEGGVGVAINVGAMASVNIDVNFTVWGFEL